MIGGTGNCSYSKIIFHLLLGPRTGPESEVQTFRFEYLMEKTTKIIKIKNNKNAFQGRNAIQQLCKTPYFMHLTLFSAFLAVPTLFNLLGKRIIRCFFLIFY